MNDFEFKRSEYEIERSLLQKAIRRGCKELTEEVVNYLLAAGDKEWLKKRLFVIAYEECWPLGAKINLKDLKNQFSNLAVSEKNKNAFALGTLARQIVRGNYKPDNNVSDEQKGIIGGLSEAIKSPKKFWSWVTEQEEYEANKFSVEAAKSALPKASFEGDKDMIYAAAYLMLAEPIPQVNVISPTNKSNFEYWIAFDKHTSIGKDILEEASKQVGILPARGERLAFYIEGAKCNKIVNSPYWDILLKWQIERMGMSFSEAEDYWNTMKPIIINSLGDQVNKLKSRLANPPIEPEDDQLGFF